MAVDVLDALAGLLNWFLVVATLPLLVELLCLTVGAILPVSNDEDGNNAAAPLKRLTVIVPCHNEEVTVVRCIESLKAAGPGQEILVIAHNCSDRTAELAAKAGARVEVVNDLTKQGKGHALKHGFDFAFANLGAEAVMIVDADSTVSPNIMTEVLKRLATSPVVQCRYQVKNYAASWRTTLTSLAFLGINVVRARGRDRLGLSSGIFGNGFAMRKEVLDNVEYDAHSIVEDMEFHLALVDHGYRVRFIREAVVLGDMPLSAKTAENQHSRWEGGRIRLLSDWGIPLLRKVLRGNLRLAEPLTDLLGLPLALEVFSLLILLLFHSSIARFYVAAAFGVILLHLAVVVHASPDRKLSIRTLLLAPAYLFWRVTTMATTVRASSKGAVWVRTERDVPQASQPSTRDILTGKVLAPEAVGRSQESL
jgi:cellulose synthase/poly-beta-1,6-N-acetylglucosamine synthase-like glycosyltransferase